MIRATQAIPEVKASEVMMEITVTRRSDNTAKPIKVRVVEFKEGKVNDIRELLAEDNPRSIHNAVRRLSTLITGVR
jgi:hypothetical protein